MPSCKRIIGFILSSIAATPILHLPWLIHALPAPEENIGLDDSISIREVNNISCSLNTKAQPFYAIGHHIKYVSNMVDALNHGANAIEIDLTPYKDQWYVDHDGITITRGDPVEKMFKSMAHQKKELNKPLTFVWLDLKDPDWFSDPSHPSSIESLQKLAREILEVVGVRVLYGFYGSQVDKRAFSVITQSLNANEAVGVDGDVTAVTKACFEQGKLTPENRKCVMSKGCFDFKGILVDAAIALGKCDKFGDCDGTGKGICPQLHLAKQQGSFQKVFGWTVGYDREDEARQMMDKANVDGIIYGRKAEHYEDNPQTRKSFKIIADWLAENKSRRCLATTSNPPW